MTGPQRRLEVIVSIIITLWRRHLPRHHCIVATNSNPSTQVNWLAELVLCSGFFLIYLVEETVHQLVQQPLAQKGNISQGAVPRSSQPSETGSNVGICREEERVHSCCDATNHNDMEMQARSESSGEPGYNPKYSVRLSDSTSSVFPNYHAPESLKPLPQENPSHLHLLSSFATPRIVRDLSTVLALSFHAVFEGLAIGLEGSTAGVWQMLAPIASHKFLATFSLSLQLMQSGTTSFGFALFLITFSLISPLGIGVGLAALEFADDQTSGVDQVTVAVLQGLAGGAIIYLVVFELLQRERGRDVAALLQLV